MSGAVEVSTPLKTLTEHYRTAARRFLQTAIVVDDLAFLGPVTLVPSEALTPPSGSVLTGGAPPPNVMLEQGTNPPAAGLNAKVLSDAFLREDMICGLYKPTSGEDMVDRTIRAARRSDIVIVDWNLEPGSSRSAKDIILGLLKSDRAERGRLRLIAVYTSQAGRPESAQELLAEIEADHLLKGRLTLDGSVLVGTDTRVVFLNKRGALTGPDADAVSEEALPPRLVEEFSLLGQGLLASFALSSIAAVRRGAHHLLALYGRDLDASFVAHRCGIRHPEDAGTFATDLIASELRNLIEIDDVAEHCLGADVVGAWVESLIATGHAFQSDDAEIPNNVVRDFVMNGATSVADSANKHHLHGKSNKQAKKPITAGRLARAFYATAKEAKVGTGSLSRLSTFQREARRSHFPAAWRPMLSLGTVVQGSRPAEGVPGPILVCVQPRCDSVRLPDVAAFPFQTVTVGDDHFNLVLCDIDNAETQAWVNLKPRDARMLCFKADPIRAVVLATQDSEGLYVFRDADDQPYTWLGDLKEMKAQLWASELGSRVNAVGIEEFEWLRWAGERKFKRDWT
jgi:hypothetical protein